MRPTAPAPARAIVTLRVPEGARSTFLEDVKAAYEDALERYPRPRASLHEGYALMLEEVEEAWAEIKKSESDRDPASVYLELTHIVATAWRMAVECGLVES